MVLAQHRLHPPILGTRSTAWPDEAACAAFAQRLAAATALWPSTFVALDGPLGAGKTTFVRHLLRALGVAGRIKSPTFAVLEPYDLADGRRVSHFDFYRFADAHEWDDAGFRDVFAEPGLKLAEWPDKVGPALPLPDWRLQIDTDANQARQVQVHAFTPHGVELLAMTLPRPSAP
jgi:tRNA threonylcarbamoyladenosine biosynthesis protein TsaE